MRPIDSLSEDDIRILFILADKKGHPSWEIKEILEQEKKDRIKKERLPSALLYDKKSGKILGKVDEHKTKTSRVDEGNLSKRINLLESEGRIYTNTRPKTRGQNARGPKDERAHYIEKNTYLSLDRMHLHNLKIALGKFNLAFRGKYKQEIGEYVDGSPFISEGVMVEVDEDTRINRENCLMRFYQWNRSKNPPAFDKYIQAAIDSAEYKTVDSGRPYLASIPAIPDLIEIGGMDKENCREQMKSYLEELIAINLSCGLEMPKIGGIALPHSTLS
jgi:hypothetical protein